MSEELVEQQQNEVPDWLMGESNEGFEEVQDDQGFQEYRLCTKMSKVFEEEEVDLGHIYNVQTSEDLGEYRDLLIFKYRKTFQLSNDENMGILCKSYDKETGNARVYQDDWDEEAIEGLGITADELNNEDESIVTRSCDECPFHPYNGWRTEDGEKIPPRCDVSHEFYVLDLTEGFDKIPYLIRITENSRLKRNVAKELNGLLNRKLKLKNVPIYGGVFRFSSHKVKNSRGKKNSMWKIDFNGYVKDKQIAEFAKESLRQFNKDAERRAKESEKRMAEKGEEEKDTGKDEQDGTPWDNEDDDDEEFESPFEE